MIKYGAGATVGIQGLVLVAREVRLKPQVWNEEENKTSSLPPTVVIQMSESSSNSFSSLDHLWQDREEAKK